jgi:hypothetical protein
MFILALLLAFMVGGAPSVPNHAPRMAYVGGQYAYLLDSPTTEAHVDYPRMDISSHVAPPYYGNTLCPVGGACKPWAYYDPNTNYCTNDTIDWDNLAELNETWYLHSGTPPTSGNRLRGTGGTCPNQTGTQANYPNLSNSAAIAAMIASNFSNRVAAPTGIAPANQGVFDDDNRYYFSQTGGPPYEYPTVAAMRQAEAAFIAAVAPSQVICNGLGTGGGFYGTGNPSSGGTANYTINWADLYTPANLVGCTFEGPLDRYNGGGGGEVNVRIVINVASQILQSSSKAFSLLDYTANTDGSTNEPLRTEHLALKMLIAGNNLARVFDWQASHTNSTAFVAGYPEQELYFIDPLKAQHAYVYNSAGSGSPELPFGNGTGCRNAFPSGNHAIDTLDTGGVDDVVVACPSGSGHGTDTGGNPAAIYAQEYQYCYYQGSFIGGCAALFNATNHSETIQSSWFKSPTYGHTITWAEDATSPLPWACASGCTGGINLTATGVTFGATTIAANSALILSF